MQFIFFFVELLFSHLNFIRNPLHWTADAQILWTAKVSSKTEHQIICFQFPLLLAQKLSRWSSFRVWIETELNYEKALHGISEETKRKAKELKKEKKLLLREVNKRRLDSTVITKRASKFLYEMKEKVIWFFSTALTVDDLTCCCNNKNVDHFGISKQGRQK